MRDEFILSWSFRLVDSVPVVFIHTGRKKKLNKKKTTEKPQNYTDTHHLSTHGHTGKGVLPARYTTQQLVPVWGIVAAVG